MKAGVSILCALTVVSVAGTMSLADGPAAQRKVVFVAASDAEPYAQALDGFRTLFPNAASIVLDPKDPLHTPALQTVLARAPSAWIAAGSDAIDAVNLTKTEAPVIGTMVLNADKRSRGGWPPLAVHLDIAPSQIAADVAALFPDNHRIALISSGSEAEDAERRLRYQRAGIQIVNCAAAGELMRTFVSLRGKADFVLTEPDATLYNSTTVKPLILASLEHRLPIIGFSASFVRSGAAVGIYPDFRDVGAQAAVLAQKLLAGETRSAYEEPRSRVVAVNQRILRLLGLDYRHRDGLVVFR